MSRRAARATRQGSAPARSAPAAQLRQLGLRPRKRLSQSFLADEGVAQRIVRLAHLDATVDEVLEIGPGLGVLTRHLVRQARRVVAVELDEDLTLALRAKVVQEHLEVHTADILTLDPSDLFRDPYAVVANLPYHITSPVLRHLLSVGPPRPTRLVLMVQREVGDRLVASPGRLSALAVATQIQAKVTLGFKVSAKAFYPQPKVDSAVLVLVPWPDDELAVPRAEIPTFAAFVQAGFTQPRKQLANSLAQGLDCPRAEVLELLTATSITPVRRPQELAIQEWVTLFRTHQKRAA